MPSEYTIRSGDDTLELVQAVNEAIKDGWIPQGGMVAVRWVQSKHATEYWQFYQAMVKDAE